MLLMITLLTFSQMTMEISVYGFMANQRNIEIVNEIQENIKKQKTSVEVETADNTSVKVKKTKEKTGTVKITEQSVFLLGKPIEGGVTSSYFGESIDRSGPHIGHDWAVNIGTSVMACEKGVVEKAYYSKSYGYNILINHGNGIKTRYAHLSRLKVEKGAPVVKGEIIGLSGNTGDSTGPHLHFEVIKEGNRVDPLNYLR